MSAESEDKLREYRGFSPDEALGKLAELLGTDKDDNKIKMFSVLRGEDTVLDMAFGYHLGEGTGSKWLVRFCDIKLLLNCSRNSGRARKDVVQLASALLGKMASRLGEQVKRLKSFVEAE